MAFFAEADEAADPDFFLDCCGRCCLATWVVDEAASVAVASAVEAVSEAVVVDLAALAAAAQAEAVRSAVIRKREL